MNKENKTVALFAVIFIVLAGMAWYFASQTQEEVDLKKQEIAQIKTEIEALRKEAAQEEALVEELESLKVNFAQYVKILPSPKVATEERLMAMLQEKCERTQFELLNYTARPPGRGRKSGSGFQEIDVTMNSEGTFEQFLRFLNSLERHESFLRVNSFNCVAPREPEFDAEGKEIWPLKINLNVSTFRYEAGGK